ncbi:helix-turn-helix domain-containing protein [Roseateles sp. LYH14W]|uniref:Helix-turn-helix domain-containing protein n=1 Tax=Pelomonas parva TaxID=3299032 RepID=A0ABW7FA91_9BURK
MQKNLHTQDQLLLRELLVELRNAAQLTQVDLAKRLEWEQTHVSRVERGVRRLDVLELRRWVNAMDVSLPDFVALFEQRLEAHTPPRL